MPNLNDILIPGAIALIMFGIGLHIKLSDFKLVFLRPRPMIAGLISQMVVLPLFAFLLMFLWPLDPIYKAGFILVAACPGGTASNLVTHLLKGNLALSISLTAFNSALIILSIPLVMNLGTSLFLNESHEIHLSMRETFGDVLLKVLLPSFVGLLVNEYLPKVSEALKSPLNWLMPIVLFGVFIYLIFFDSGNINAGLGSNFLLLLLPGVVLNFATMYLGFVFPLLFKVSSKDRYTIAIQVGLQNSALAIYIADQILQSKEMVLVAVVYSSFSFFSTLFIAWRMKTRVYNNALSERHRKGKSM